MRLPACYPDSQRGFSQSQLKTGMQGGFFCALLLVAGASAFSPLSTIPLSGRTASPVSATSGAKFHLLIHGKWPFCELCPMCGSQLCPCHPLGSYGSEMRGPPPRNSPSFDLCTHYTGLGASLTPWGGIPCPFRSHEAESCSPLRLSSCNKFSQEGPGVSPGSA